MSKKSRRLSWGVLPLIIASPRLQPVFLTIRTSVRCGTFLSGRAGRAGHSDYADHAKIESSRYVSLLSIERVLEVARR